MTGIATYEEFVRLPSAAAQEGWLETQDVRAAARASHAQHLWRTMDREQPGAGDQSIVDARLFRGGIDAALLGRALGEVYDRHQALATRYVEVGGRLFALASSRGPRIEVLASDAPVVDRANIERLVTRWARPAPPMIGHDCCGAIVLEFQAGSVLLIQRFHHSLMDGWSLTTMLGELETVYDALVRGEQPALDAPEATYGDFVAWEAEWQASEAASADARYWRAALDGGGSPVRLREARSLTPSHCGGGIVLRTLDADAGEALRQYARRHRLSLFGVMAACYALALARRSGQHDITIGTSVAARPSRRFERVVGCFANRVPIRLVIAVDQTTDEYVERVRAAVHEAFSHQFFPLREIRGVAVSTEVRSRSAPLAAFLSVEPFSAQSLTLAGVAGEDVEPYDTDTWFETALWAGGRVDGGLRLDFRYSDELYDADSHEALADAFAHSVEALVSFPGSNPLSDLFEAGA